MAYPQYSDLKDKIVFITGGGSGIGAACVDGFIQAGCKVGFVSLNKEQGNLLCDTIEQKWQNRPLFISCDISDIEKLDAAIDTVVAEFGNIDILINNAARDTRHSLQELTSEQWDQSLNVNLKPHFFTAKKVAPAMSNKKVGSIIQMGSNSSLLGLAGYPAYVTAKAGIIGLAKALARELGVNGIRVNTLIPGWVMTERQKKLWVTEEALKECLDQQCLKQAISEADIVNAALFLAADASKMMSGQTLIIDGGRS